MTDDMLISWDYTERVSSEAKYRIENWKEFDEYDEQPNEEDMFETIASDPFFSQEEWQEFIECFGEILKERNPEGYWSVDVQCFGWRCIDGHAEFFADTAEEFIRRLLPNCDCTFRVYPDGKHGLKIQNFHHDSPVGKEWYYIEKAKNPDEEE
jgi:hypothetical protein